MVAYYNEVDARAAAWLRALIAQGLIASGEVDQRDIRDVRPDDLHGFDQVHLFAGIVPQLGAAFAEAALQAIGDIASCALVPNQGW